MSLSPTASLPKVERWLVGGVALVATLVWAAFFYRTAVLKHLDTVFLFQSVQSILAGHGPMSEVVSSWSQVYPLFGLPAQEVCARPLAFVVGAPYNVLGNHAYVALYAVAALAGVTGTEVAFALLHSAAHVGVLVLPYWFLRRRGVPVLASLAFGVLVAAYPAWSLSAAGDYYMDRLAMPLLLWLLYLLHHRAEAAPGAPRPRLAAIAALAIAAALFTERSAIMVLGALSFFVVFHPALRRDRDFLRMLAVVAAAVLAYLAWYFGVMYEGIAGGGHLVKQSTHSLDALLARLTHPGMRPFLATNLVFLGWLALLSGWRPLLLAAGAMLPNVVISIGGAEYTGWGTHYHTMYIPFLVYAASLGYAKVVDGVAFRWARTGLALVVVLAAAVLARNFDPYTAHWSRKNPSLSAHWGGAGMAWRFFRHRSESSEWVAARAARSIAGVIPAGASVSAVEGAMPAVYAGRRLSMYPVGLDSADYLVVSGTARDGALVDMTGAVSYLGPAEGAALDRCLALRAGRQGFVLVKDLPAIGLVVLRRQQPPRP
jgi:hypothetical protein